MKKEIYGSSFGPFFSEIPLYPDSTISDYPADIQIIHAYDKPRSPVLSEAQVSIMAAELLREAKRAQKLQSDLPPKPML